MSERPWRGSFAIPMTPYDERDRIDEEVLAAEIEFCIESGAGGLVTPVMVSEFRVLSEEERRTMIRVPLAVSAGRVPVIANCAAVNTPLAVSFARYAQEAGADAVIAMPPYTLRPDFETIYAYYQAVSDAVTIPVWIQNAGIAALSADQIARLCTEIENVSWVKEEVHPSTHSIGALVSRGCPAIEGVMGGGGGRYMIAEYARGAKGVVHACQFCDVVQHVWDLLEAGREDDARDLHEHVLPGLVLEGLMGMAFAKEIMVRRGVFRNHRIRSRARPLDEYDMREIDRVWERIQPYLRWHR
ncbi:MAG TPA: dihydrodipicolinate synthase family protein [Anaerolineae bacterium]|nr:dihydrodipicolinate synthase family protein [Anaerolineae bacterium]